MGILRQEEYSPEDPANPCVNYPTEEYESYADCDDHFIRRFLPPGLQPFWNVDHISEATDTITLDYELYSKLWPYLGIFHTILTRLSRNKYIYCLFVTQMIYTLARLYQIAPCLV